MKKVVIVVVLAVAIAGVFVLKSRNSGESANGTASTNEAASVTNALPKLLDLGADKCHACKMMMPVLDELRQALPGKLEVEFIDVGKDREAGQSFGISSIPTQIFFSADGKEIFRHVGFFSKDDILDQWRTLGIDFTDK